MVYLINYYFLSSIYKDSLLIYEPIGSIYLGDYTK